MWICHRCVCALCIQMPNYAGCAFCRWVANHWIGVAMSGRIEEINLQGAHLMIFGSSKSKCDLPPWGKDLFLSFINTSRNPHHPFGTTQCHHSHPHLSEQVDATTMVALSLGRKITNGKMQGGLRFMRELCYNARRFHQPGRW